MKFGFKYGSRISMYVFDKNMNKIHQTRQVSEDYKADNDEIIIDVYESDPVRIEKQIETIFENKELFDKLYLEDLIVEMYVREHAGDPSTANIKGLYHLRNRVEDHKPTWEEFFEMTTNIYKQMYEKS